MGCCSGYNFTPAPDAALDPAQRVNFHFGMVLGVDDFRQEHAYLAGRDERALRELIGYGVITGLQVGTQVGAGNQVEVRVAPGLALLPHGKLVAVPADQCARLDEWVAGPGREDRPDPGPASVYVVLRHVEVAGTPVPIPGEPCRDESALVADSRIADSFQLAFQWEPPAQPEDDALRTFAAWLRRVDVRPAPVPHTALEDFMDEVGRQAAKAIENARQAFADPPLSETPAPDSGDGDGSPPQPLVIPREHYAQYINAAFDVWVRQLRAGHMAHFGPVPPAEHNAEAGLLLAAIDFELANGELSFRSPPDGAPSVRWLGRAQLVHMRLLQEWLLTTSDQDAPVDATYVLGRGDTRLPNAQDLRSDFAGADHALARVDLPADRDGKAALRPAAKWPGPDYYGPRMEVPIPVSDGGTGQNHAPERGQLLVGTPAGRNAFFSLGHLLAAEHRLPDGSAGANLKVDLAKAPDIRIDTVQDIGTGDSPRFAGLEVAGTASIGQLQLRKPLAPGSGGTGLAAPPKPRQVLVGADDNSGTYLQAALADSDTVKVRMQAGANGWQVQFDAAGGTDITLPLPVTQGGTGLASAPRPRQLLIGGTDNNYTLGHLRPVTEGRHIAVAQAGADIAIDTTPQAHWATRIVDGLADRLRKDDHVLLFTAQSDGIRFALDDPEDERVVVIKVLGRNASVDLVRSLEQRDDEPFIDDAAFHRVLRLQAVTLIGNVKLKRWFIIGKA